MSKEDRKDIWFLKVNDDMFKPEVNPVMQKIDMELYSAEETSP